MTTSSRVIVRNASFLMVSQVITWSLSFLLTIFLPRYLGPAGMGQIQLAASLWAIVGVIASLGTDKLVMKEIARAPDRVSDMVSSTLVLRTVLFIAGALGMLAYLELVDYPTQTVWIIWIIGFGALIGQIGGTYNAALRGLEYMQYTSVALIISFAVGTLVQLGLVFMGYGVILIAASGLLSSSVNLAIEAHFLQKASSFKLSVNRALILSVVQASLPYFLVSIGMVVYHQVDIVIISLLADETTIGWYGTAIRLYGTLLFIPNVFVMALFPALSRAYTGSPTDSNKLAQKSLNLLMLVGVPIGFGVAVLANPIVVLLYGPAFAKSGPVLAMLGMLLIVTYVNMLLGFLLISMDRQKTMAVVMLVMTFATIVLDLILVPWTIKAFGNGALGGALSYVLTESGMLIAGIALLPKGAFNRGNVQVISRLILAGAVMATATWLVREAFLLIPVVVGAVTYIGMILILRALPKEDWDSFFKLGSILFDRLRRRPTASAELKG